MKRNIIRIDEEKCNGCGLCIPNCQEGALQVIDGKARLISDLFCDGLGACLGHCPEGAITVEEREAEPYDERKVMEKIIEQGPETVKAHLDHLADHGEKELLAIAKEVLAAKGMTSDNAKPQEGHHMHHGHGGGGCPGSAEMRFKKTAAAEPSAKSPSELTQWPVQLHLISPESPAFKGQDVVLAADCAAYAYGGFHQRFLKGKALAIACPKLDEGQDVYLEKLTAMIDQAQINTLTVVIMEVPCCGGLLRLAQEASSRAKRKIPIKSVVISRQGEVISEEWV
jgi:ferredoxin